MIKKLFIPLLITIILAFNVLAASLSDKTLGSSDAPVTIELFTDFQGPFDSRWHTQTFPLIRENYIDKITIDTRQTKARLIVRYFPLSFHTNAKAASIAAECTAEQKEFFGYIDLLYNNQDKLSEEDFKEYAEKLKLDIDQFTSCLSDKETVAIVEEDIENGQKLGVSGVPTFFINGEKLVGAQPFSVFQQVIDSQLGKTLPETKKCPVGCSCTGDEIECPAEEKRIECTLDSDCGELGKCPDGSTYEKYACENNMCAVVNYFRDPCETLETKKEPAWSDMQREPIRGNLKADIQIIGYMGYNDPFSRRAWDILDKLFDKFEDNINFEFRNFPLSFQDPNSVAAVAGECVLGLSNTGAFFEFSDSIMELDRDDRVQEDDLIRYGKRVGVDIESCLDINKFLPEVLDDIEKGKDDNVRGTPTFFINKEKIVGAQPYNIFANIIRRQLGEEPEEEEETEEEIEIPSEEEEIEEQVCIDGKIKKYSCTDGTEIDWCECIGNKWICVSSPQILCPLQKPLCTTGCDVDGKCIPYGQRLQSDGQNSYCGLSGNLETQKLEEASCQNNYECVNNQCSSGQCIDITKKLEETTGLLEKILDFFRRFFGG